MSAPDVVLEVLHRPCGEYRRPCPQCDKGTKDTALAIKITSDGAVWFCHRCHYTGACNEGREARTVAGYQTRAQRPAVDIPLRWSERAQGIWARSMPLIGTIGEVYLRVRHCVLPPGDSDLRYLPPSDNFPPCLVARVTDFETNEPMTLHFTKLKPNGDGKAGTERDRLLLKGHQKRGGVIRLWPDEAVTLSIAIGEGIETCLSAAKFHSPVWCAIDAGNLGALPVINGIESLIILADHDAAGIAAAHAIVQRWRMAGRSAFAMASIEPGTDINDAVNTPGAA